MPRRERATIVGDLLRQLGQLEAQGNVTLTRLASKANLPYDRFRVYFQELQDAGLIAKEEPIRLTYTGREFLERYEKWLDALRLLGLDAGRADSGRPGL